ncbi:molybdate ABC transporter substrate-binding protein [Rhizobium sp. SSA_523]|uniref:molybdate ABC transporter substrate-binding protein n=1 Tax=Rhizobium sp. SSA_523 TaxID=2952477 RepID=UPI002091A6E9|nr:molybdate ABC transporter substrate-binding protein [Rhizobium sp. SSA_523]MCO5734496.1 molybdate ABC transporter substrate-binding protein [Rhizobium sp. SSA_523]WKC25763.1 molybdate ABC transporter substrate-binding protein [Rhizobium sp. SSA_523]
MFLSLLCSPVPAADSVTVFAAASMKTVLDAANAAYEQGTGGAVTASYAASSALAKQIEAGAPADIFISADQDWMDYLQQKGLVVQGTRSDLVGNRLVLIAPSAVAKPVDIRPGFDLAGLLGDGRLAMGAVESVPAGKYGKAALQALQVWDSVSAKVAGAENVRAALALVSRGEAPLGIVYATDAAADPTVAVIATLPESSHPPIRYPVALMTAAKTEAARAYLAFLTSEKAAPYFRAQGFEILR